jgi:hypothetical protein
MGSASQPAPSREIVRQILLGLHGPYADPRVALDTLDNVATLATELDIDGLVHLAALLVDLTDDSDNVVATGAVLALDVLHRSRPDLADRLADLVERMVDLVLGADDSLDRPPTGFDRATRPTLRAELAVAAARWGSPAAVPALSMLVDRSPTVGVARVDLVAALAERLPALVVAHAQEWLGPDDSAVLARLRDHNRRLAVATAVRPWSERAIHAIESAGQWQKWHEAELDAIVRVMRDEAPELTAPWGVGDSGRGGRWWIVADHPWDWTLWRCDDGSTVLERVEGGVGMWTSVHDVSAEVAAWIVAEVVVGTELTGRDIPRAFPDR